MTNDQYWELNKHFTEPKTKYVHKKLPRKAKKKMKKMKNLIDSLAYPLCRTVKTLGINAMMWCNPNYRTYLIKKCVTKKN